MKKEIFDSLAKLSPELCANCSTPKQSPAVEISGQLAFCLETLMNTVGKQMNLTPQNVLEKILDVGIDNWVDQWSDSTKRTVGFHPPKGSQNIVVDDEYDDDDPDPAHAQQAAYAQLTESYGYTPLTAHSVGKGGNGNGRGDQRGGSSNGRKNPKQKKVRGAQKKHPSKKSNSRRRKFTAQKPQSSSVQ